MMTQTHILLGAVLFANRDRIAVTTAAIAGALVPDVDLWLMIVAERAAGSSGCEIFHYRYWEAPWTTVQAIGNSIPLYGLILLLGMAMALPGRGEEDVPGFVQRAGYVVTIFAASALLHVCTDFLLHHDDARRHFWPLTNWIFRSPVSYWDPAHHGEIFVLFEIVFGVGCAALLWQRFRGRKARAMLLLCCLGYSLTLYASIFGAAAHDRGPGSCDDRPTYFDRGSS